MYVAVFVYTHIYEDGKENGRPSYDVDSRYFYVNYRITEKCCDLIYIFRTVWFIVQN